MFKREELEKNSDFLKSLYFATLKKKKKIIEKAKLAQLRLLVKIFTAVLTNELPLSEENINKLRKSKKSASLHNVFSDIDQTNELLKKASTYHLKSTFMRFVPAFDTILSPLYVEK